MADYRLATEDQHGPVIRTADGAWIPNDPANMDWVEYQNWLEIEGNEPDPYEPPPENDPVPSADERIDAGVEGAVTAWNDNPVAVATPKEVSTSPDVQELQARVTRLEATIKAMCAGQMEAAIEARFEEL